MSVRMSARDVDALVGIAVTMLQPTDPHELGPKLLPQLQQLIPADVTMWAETDLQAGELRMTTWPDPSVAQDYSRANPTLASEHPHPAYVARTGDGSPHMISDFLTEDAFHATRMYDELYRPLGLEDEMGTVVAQREPVVIGILAARPRRTFTQRDRRALNLVRPLVINGYRNAEARARHRAALQGLEDVAERADEGLILIDRDHRIQLRTPRGRDILSRWWNVDNDHIPEELHDWLSRSRAQQSIESLEPLVIERGSQRLVVRVLWNAGENGEDAIVLQERRVRANGRPLASLGLTPRQCDVLALVALGRANEEIAQELALRPATVQKHLEHIYTRLGVSNRTAAARLALQEMLHSSQ